MTPKERRQWMALWAAEHGLQLVLDGEVGFGRDCVGVITDGNYPDYEWYDADYTSREDNNGDVWTPPDAYHKHPCVAVLGHSDEAERQLYEWLRWFDAHSFEVEVGVSGKADMISVLLGQHVTVRMVRPEQAAATSE